MTHITYLAQRVDVVNIAAMALFLHATYVIGGFLSYEVIRIISLGRRDIVLANMAYTKTSPRAILAKFSHNPGPYTL